MDRAGIQRLVQQVKNNQAKLKHCPNHDFSTRNKINFRWTCSNCGGEVGLMEKAWYEKGKEHAGK